VAGQLCLQRDEKMSSNIESTTKLGYAEYVCFPNDGFRHEVINGDHYMNPAPSTYHQTVSKRLQYQLYQQIELRDLGLLFDAPIDIQLSENDIVQPDLVVLLNAKKSIITPTKIKGVPDLLVEIISPSSLENDRVLKKSIYQRMGVAEYWIVDPFEHTVDQLVLVNGVYKSRPHTDQLCPVFVNGVVIELDKVW
jgi:Uma2 family endonuclease